MNYKKLLATLGISLVVILNTNDKVYAMDSLLNMALQMEEAEKTEKENLNNQINELYEKISKETSLNKSFIKQLHLLAGGKATYIEKYPNVYKDETSKTLPEPLRIKGAHTQYQKADFIKCINDNVERPSKYYLPDAIYSVAYDISSIMSQRYCINREGMQIHFDALKEDVKQQIVFYEAVLIYTGESEETVNNWLKTYEKILYDKNINENITEETETGLKIKDKFITTINNMGFTNENTLKHLALMLSFDKNIAINDDIETVKDIYNVPYKPNYTSRENMMLAAISLTGKVRYVWGGGHSGASYIDGINPVWKKWNELYPNEPSEEGFGTCIKPSGSWCPLHGYSNGECYKGGLMHNIDEYIEMRADTLDFNDLQSEKYKELLKSVKYSDGIGVHTLDGLDCSGFASWVYNQATDKFNVNSTAMNFVHQYGVKEVPYGSKLLPGDVFSWTTHIVVVVGKATDSGNSYVTIEQTPNMLKFGVIYYNSATSYDIGMAKQIASEANKLIGNIDSNYEAPHCYCMDNVGNYTRDLKDTDNPVIVSNEIDGTVNVTTIKGEPAVLGPNQSVITINRVDGSVNGLTAGGEQITLEPDGRYLVHTKYRAIGRLNTYFIDEGVGITEDGTSIENMKAIDIIQHTLTKLPISYVDGYDLYDGNLFNKDLVASNLGINIVDNNE